MALATPRAEWQRAVGDDWQPFSLSASKALEAGHATWSSGGPSSVQVRCGSSEWTLDFQGMLCWGAGGPAEASRVQREELFPHADLLVLRGELERLQAERDALAAELEALRSQASGEATPRTSASGAGPWPPFPKATELAALAMPGVAMTPGACTATSGASWRSALSQGSGLFAVSASSLESIAEWVFALNAHGVQPKTSYERVLVPPGDPRRQWLEDYLVGSIQPHRRSYNSDEWCPAAEVQVMKIWEVINEKANLCYRRELGQLRASRPGNRTRLVELDHAIHVRTDISGPQLNEALLFHGCKWETVFAILREGFDSRLGGTNAGAAFGIGSYFSTVSSKADQYTQRWGDWERRPACQVPPALRCMLIARVALGEVHEMAVSDQSLRRPPLGPDGVRCDSVLGVPRARGGCVDYDEFVVYKSAQATPQFVVEYEHKPECQCRSCVNPWP